MALLRASALKKSSKGLSMTEARSGFLGRWAQRKNDALLGKPLAEPVSPAPLPVVAPPASTGQDKLQESEKTPEPQHKQDQEPPPVLSLEDVKLLTKDSDFKPFMAQNVGPDVRNAAMKKLFEDPHFNIMDGLDIYIDDYSISEPIPESMLRQMASAKFLGLFEDDEDDENKQELPADAALTPEPPETADVTAGQGVAQSDPTHDTHLTKPAPPTHDSAAAAPDPTSQPAVPCAPVASQENHADPYLRLQPDHAPSDPEAGGVS